jgi:methionine-rich copper-binding protein CopC
MEQNHTGGIQPGLDSLVEYARIQNQYINIDGSGIQRTQGNVINSTTRYSWLINTNRNGMRLDSSCGGTDAVIHNVVSAGNKRAFRLKGDRHRAFHLLAYDTNQNDISMPRNKYCGDDWGNNISETMAGNLNSRLLNSIAEKTLSANMPDAGDPNITQGNGQLIAENTSNEFLLNQSGIWYGRALDEDNIAPFTYPHFELQDPWVENRTRSDESLQSQFGLNPFTNGVQGYDFRPRKGSSLIDGGVVIPGINDGQDIDPAKAPNHPPSYTGQHRAFVGDAPDIGPYEYGDTVYWIPGYRYYYPSVPIPSNGAVDVPIEYGLAFNYPWKTDYSSTTAQVTINGPGVDKSVSLNYPNNVVFETFLPGQTYTWSVEVDGVSSQIWSFTVANKIQPLNDRSVDVNAADEELIPNHNKSLSLSEGVLSFLKFDIPPSVSSDYQIFLNLTPETVTTLNGHIMLYKYNYQGWGENLDTDNIGLLDHSSLTPLKSITMIDSSSSLSEDITEYIDSTGEISFALSVSDPNDQLSFYSKEKMVTDGVDIDVAAGDLLGPSGNGSGYAPQGDVWPSISFVYVSPPAIPTATATPTPTATPVSAPTATATPAPTATPVSAPTATATATPTPTPVSAPTATATPAPTATPVSAPAATATATPTPTPVSAPTATATPAPTATPVSAPTATATPTPTVTPVLAPTATATPTSTPTVPDSPTSVIGTSGDGEIALTWTAPANTGGPFLTDYIITYSSDGGTTWTTASDGTSLATAATITELSNGVLYQLRVAAVNSFGTGTSSSTTLTPAQVDSSYARSWGSNTTPTSLAKGEYSSASITITNIGNTAWSTNDTSYGYRIYDDTSTLVATSAITQLDADVPVGGTTTITARIDAPLSAETYSVRWDLYSTTGATWFADAQGSAAVSSLTVTDDAYYGLTWGEQVVPSSINAKGPRHASVTVTNTGIQTWSPTTHFLGYHVYDASGNFLYTGDWSVFPANLASGETVTLNRIITAHPTPGDYTIAWDIIDTANPTWFSAMGNAALSSALTVTQPVHGITWGDHTTPTSLSQDERTSVSLNLTNSGTKTWLRGAFFLSYHVFDANGNYLYTGPWSNLNIQRPQHAETITVTVPFHAPSDAGTYTIKWDMIDMHVPTWFSARNVATLDTSLTVRSGAAYGLTAGPSTLPAQGTAAQSVSVSVPLTNTGTITWDTNRFFLSYHWYDENDSYISTGQWIVLPEAVAPGASTTASITVEIPETPGNYQLLWDIIDYQGSLWFSALEPLSHQFESIESVVALS